MTLSFASAVDALRFCHAAQVGQAAAAPGFSGQMLHAHTGSTATPGLGTGTSRRRMHRTVRRLKSQLLLPNSAHIPQPHVNWAKCWFAWPQVTLLFQRWPPDASHVSGPTEEAPDGRLLFAGPRVAMAVHNTRAHECALHTPQPFLPALSLKPFHHCCGQRRPMHACAPADCSLSTRDRCAVSCTASSYKVWGLPQ